MRYLVVAVVVMTLTAPIVAQPNIATFYNGGTFQSTPPSVQVGYLAGVFDAISTNGATTSRANLLLSVKSCLDRKFTSTTLSEAHALIMSYIRSNPQNNDMAMSDVAVVAFGCHKP